MLQLQPHHADQSKVNGRTLYMFRIQHDLEVTVPPCYSQHLCWQGGSSVTSTRTMYMSCTRHSAANRIYRPYGPYLSFLVTTSGGRGVHV